MKEMVVCFYELTHQFICIWMQTNTFKHHIHSVWLSRVNRKYSWESLPKNKIFKWSMMKCWTHLWYGKISCKFSLEDSHVNQPWRFHVVKESIMKQKAKIGERELVLHIGKFKWNMSSTLASLRWTRGPHWRVQVNGTNELVKAHFTKSIDQLSESMDNRFCALVKTKWLHYVKQIECHSKTYWVGFNNLKVKVTMIYAATNQWKQLFVKPQNHQTYFIV